jgi:hypothetical protein
MYFWVFRMGAYEPSLEICDVDRSVLIVRDLQEQHKVNTGRGYEKKRTQGRCLWIVFFVFSFSVV